MDVDTQDEDSMTDEDVEMEVTDNLEDMLENFLRNSKIDDHALSYAFDETTLSLTDIFKRVLYSNDAKISPPVFSLISLCSKEVTRDGKFLKECAYLPTNRYHILMREAMRTDSHQSVSVLMSTWPFTSLSAAELITDVSVDERILFDKGSKLKYLRNTAKKFMRCLLLFLDILKTKTECTSHMRVLDLRGMPMGDRVMNHLIRKIISLSTDVSPSDDYHVILDCAICSTDTFNQLTSLFKMSNDNQKLLLQLHINKLDVSHLSPTKNWELLQQINPTELVGLSVQIALSTDYYPTISTRFPNLTSLEISDDGHIHDLTADQIQPFQINPRIRRLGLHCRRYLFHVPSNIFAGLDFLDIGSHRSRSPNSAELQVLINVPLHLYELNLNGYFAKEQQLNLWITLLTSVAPTLRILNWERCLILVTDFSLLLSCILPMFNLQYLNITESIALMREISAHALQLGAMPALRCVCLPYIDEELIDDFAPDEIPAAIWREIIDQQFAAAKTPPAAILWEQYDPEML